MDRQPTPADAELLRRMLNIREEEAELPADVLAAYWEFKVFHSRVMGASPVAPEALALIALNVTKARGEEISTAPAFDLSTLGVGDEIGVLWRTKERTGKFLEATKNGTIKVQLEGEEEPREVKADKILGVLSKAGG